MSGSSGLRRSQRRISGEVTGTPLIEGPDTGGWVHPGKYIRAGVLAQSAPSPSTSRTRRASGPFKYVKRR